MCMILECPLCHARFSVAEHLIPADGRMVRCCRCTHAWHVSPVVSASVPPVAEDGLAQPVATVPPPEMVAESVTVRANPSPPKDKPANAKPLMLVAFVLAVLWMIVAFISYFPRGQHVSALAGMYHAMGVTPTDGLVFADMHMEPEKNGSKTRYILTGSVRNQASAARMVPTVRVLLKDAKNNTVWAREYPVNATVKAGDVYPFRIANVETAFAKNVASIVVDMGNSFQLMVR